MRDLTEIEKMAARVLETVRLTDFGVAAGTAARS
jgi:hypothetical protein